MTSSKLEANSHGVFSSFKVNVKDDTRGQYDNRTEQYFRFACSIFAVNGDYKSGKQSELIQPKRWRKEIGQD